MNNIAIQLTNVSKRYTIHHEKPTLVEKFVKGRDETFSALNNINLTIKKGEKVGIIGPNGSGKTTLLKIIAGITTPTQGTVTTNGRIVSLIDLEAGFHPDLSGYQNIFINGLLLGMNKKNITSKLRHIIAFADIKQFIDAPVFTYSNGMKLRLGFSIAIYAQPKILILDENIHMGDNYFQNKIYTLLHTQTWSKITYLIVSHNMDIIKTYCQHVYALKNGILSKTILQ